MSLSTISFYSEVLQEETCAKVILPDTIHNTNDTGDDPEKAYPVLYLLHGMGDTQSTWTDMTSIEQYVENSNLAVVMPTTSLGWYTDAKCGKKWRTFIGEELPVICHNLFPLISTKREDTYIAGNSMGGYGAYALALTYPERYNAAFGFSGAYIPFQGNCLANDDDPYWTNIFGTQKEFTGSKNDLLVLSKELLSSGSVLPKLWMWCGYGDFIYDHSITMRDHLQKIGWPEFHYEDSEGGHCWTSWNIKIKDILPWIIK